MKGWLKDFRLLLGVLMKRPPNIRPDGKRQFPQGLIVALSFLPIMVMVCVEFSADHGDGVRSARAPRAPRRFARSDGGIRGRAHRRGAVHGAVFRARDHRGHALCDRGRRIRLRAASPSVRGVLRAADQTLPRRSHRLAVPAPPAALHLRRSGGRGTRRDIPSRRRFMC